MEPIRVAFILSISFHLFFFGVSPFFVPKTKICSAPHIVTLIQEEPKKSKKIQLESLKKEEIQPKKSLSVKNESKKKKVKSKKKIPRLTKKATLPKVKKLKKKVKLEKKDPPLTNSHKVVQKAVAQIQQKDHKVVQKAVAQIQQKEKQKSLQSIRQSVEDIQRKLLEQKIATVQEDRISARAQTNFYVNAYYSQVTNLVNSHWLLPESGYDKGKKLLTVVSIRVNKDGLIQDVKIESESGDPLLDNSILIAIKRVGSFPPFPPEMPEDTIEIGLQFSPPED